METSYEIQDTPVYLSTYILVYFPIVNQKSKTRTEFIEVSENNYGTIYINHFSHDFNSSQRH